MLNLPRFCRAAPLLCLQACQLPFKHTRAQLARQASVCPCLCLRWLISDPTYLSDWDIRTLCLSVCLPASVTPNLYKLPEENHAELKWSQFGEEIWMSSRHVGFSSLTNAVWSAYRRMSLLPLCADNSLTINWCINWKRKVPPHWAINCFCWNYT